MHFFSAPFHFWVEDNYALCLLVDAPLLVCVPSDRFAPVHCAPSARWCSLVLSSGIACSICAHACSTAVFTLCSCDSFLHFALLVFYLNSCICGFRAHTFLWLCLLPCSSVLNDSMLL
jgi:hypothetical protein